MGERGLAFVDGDRLGWMTVTDDDLPQYKSAVLVAVLPAEVELERLTWENEIAKQGDVMVAAAAIVTRYGGLVGLSHFDLDPLLAQRMLEEVVSLSYS